MIHLYSSLEDFVDRFFVILATLRVERDHRAANSFQRKLVMSHPVTSVERQYSELLTSYASSFVLKQLKMSTNISRMKSSTQNGEYNFEKDEVLSVTAKKCSCCFFNSMLLPCRHIFALRRQLDINLFDGDLCAQRWKSLYYRKKCRLFRDDGISSTVNYDHQTIQPSAVLTEMKRFRVTQLITNKVADVVSEQTGAIFDHQVEQLKTLLDLWGNGKEVLIAELNEQSMIRLAMFLFKICAIEITTL